MAQSLDSMIKELAASVTERCRKRIEEAKKHPPLKQEEGIFSNRKRELGL